MGISQRHKAGTGHPQHVARRTISAQNKIKTATDQLNAVCVAPPTIDTPKYINKVPSMSLYGIKGR